MANDTTDEEKAVLGAIELKRIQLEQDVLKTEAAREEAKLRLSAFRASALAALGAASGSKSAQKQRSERQKVVAQMLSEGISRAEIVRRTGLVDHLVGYDIDCIRRGRKKQGTQKVFASPPPKDLTKISAEDSRPNPHFIDDNTEEDLESDATDETEKATAKPVAAESVGSPLNLKPATTPFASKEPGKPGIARPGCAASRDQLKSAAKEIQRSGRKTCSFVTTTDKGHSHVMSLDLMGDGATLTDNAGHRHRACRFEMLESDHLHGITLEQK